MPVNRIRLSGRATAKKGILPPYRAAITPLKSSTLDIFHSISRILLYRQYSGLFPLRQGKPGHCPVNVRISGLWYTRTQSHLKPCRRAGRSCTGTAKPGGQPSACISVWISFVL